jgi:hypothetical protein
LEEKLLCSANFPFSAPLPPRSKKLATPLQTKALKMTFLLFVPGRPTKPIASESRHDLFYNGYDVMLMFIKTKHSTLLQKQLLRPERCDFTSLSIFASLGAPCVYSKFLKVEFSKGIQSATITGTINVDCVN